MPTDTTTTRSWVLLLVVWPSTIFDVAAVVGFTH
jgi:hypothetical protein